MFDFKFEGWEVVLILAGIFFLGFAMGYGVSR